MVATNILGVNKLPRDTRGNLEIAIQDQFSRILDLYFIKATGAASTLAVAASPDTSAITVASSTGFSDGDYIGVFTPAGHFYFGYQLGAPSGNIISLDTPIDCDCAIGSNVLAFSTNLAVDGSTTPQIFQVGPVGAATVTKVDVTRISGYLEDASAMDDAKFGGISALTKGIILRQHNGVLLNIWNAKTNGELALLSAGDMEYTDKAPAGLYGARFRNTFNGPEKHGVTVRLDEGETLELIVQDDLTGLTKFNLMAQGHVVEQ